MNAATDRRATPRRVASGEHGVRVVVALEAGEALVHEKGDADEHAGDRDERKKSHHLRIGRVAGERMSQL